MKKIILLFLIFTISCDKESSIINTNEYLIKSYHINYMDYPTILVSPELSSIVSLEYDTQNRVVKRIGGILEIPSSTGYSYTFSKEVYDEVTYKPNKIIIDRKTSSNKYKTFKFKRTLFMDNESKIIQKVIETNNYNDTINYEYNSTKQLINIRKNKNFPNNKINFYYNKNKNLDSIVTNIYDNKNLYLGKSVQIFKDYDRENNPMKNLTFFEETFNRSLSNNNYSTLIKLRFDRNNKLTSSEEIHQKLFYDENKNVSFDRIK